MPCSSMKAPRWAQPLHLCAGERGDLPVLELLVSPAYGAESSAMDDEGMRPLHRAAMRGHLPVIERLIFQLMMLPIRVPSAAVRAASSSSSSAYSFSPSSSSSRTSPSSFASSFAAPSSFSSAHFSSSPEGGGRTKMKSAGEEGFEDKEELISFFKV